MTKEQAERWLPEITHWANGGNLWWEQKGVWRMYVSDIDFTENTPSSYIIEDKHKDKHYHTKSYHMWKYAEPIKPEECWKENK